MQASYTEDPHDVRHTSKSPHLPAERIGNLREVMPLIKRSPRQQRPCQWRRAFVRLPPELDSRIARAIGIADLEALVVLHAWLRDRQVYQDQTSHLRDALRAHVAAWGALLDAADRAIRRAVLRSVLVGADVDAAGIATVIAREACLALLRTAEVV